MTSSVAHFPPTVGQNSALMLLCGRKLDSTFPKQGLQPQTTYDFLPPSSFDLRLEQNISWIRLKLAWGAPEFLPIWTHVKDGTRVRLAQNLPDSAPSTRRWKIYISSSIYRRRRRWYYSSKEPKRISQNENLHHNRNKYCHHHPSHLMNICHSSVSKYFVWQLLLWRWSLSASGWGALPPPLLSQFRHYVIPIWAGSTKIAQRRVLTLL